MFFMNMGTSEMVSTKSGMKQDTASQHSIITQTRRPQLETHCHENLMSA